MAIVVECHKWLQEEEVQQFFVVRVETGNQYRLHTDFQRILTQFYC